MKNYFAFIDESGNSLQERFFGLGLLIIDDEIGDFYDWIKPFYDKASDIARNNKSARIAELVNQNDLNQISEIANSGKRFELKFKYVNVTNNFIYAGLIEKYFLFPNVRFCALVIDRQKQKKNNDWIAVFNPWDAYIQQAAMLISNNIKNISPCQLCILADDLTRPLKIQKSFERSLSDAINYRLKKCKMTDMIFGVARLESHASLMLQVVDILLGCVMYDYKKPVGLISQNLTLKQEMVVEKLHQKLGVDSLSQNKTFHKPNYFSIWEFNK